LDLGRCPFPSLALKAANGLPTFADVALKLRGWPSAQREKAPLTWGLLGDVKTLGQHLRLA
jgi:hypothetical protein